MTKRGRHLAPRSKRRNARLFGRAVPLALALTLMMTAVAWADHDVAFSSAVGGTTVTVAPGGTAGTPATASVTAGAAVDFTATSAAGGNHLQIHQCLTRDRDAGGDAIVSPEAPLPVAACVTVNSEFGNTDGVWVLRAQQSNPDGLTAAIFQWDTTTFAGYEAGFRAQRVPPGNHADAQRYIELTVAGGGNGHPGCNGIENAYEQVTTNNGATQSKGKGAQALEKVAEKLGCDLSG